MRARLIAGVDEAGRGPLAGPVVAAAVILGRGQPPAGLDDSKRLSATRRRELESAIKQQALAWAVAAADVDEIDEFNILQATLLAMRRAVEQLSVAPDFARVDGPHAPRLACPTAAVVRGDALHAEISAASILAKEARDRIMTTLAAQYPGYGFARHKGYPTRAHLDALRARGACRAHRRSFAPVKRLITAA